ncbi:hypothetical protein MGYG_08994 [Nannizzia gypsea CBS 118893]|uniref:Uncharacterized protein n=1 Tax=Arthroderma gypseum (strain ATCC MYA-4604 / CBS 118893) TaxID=535722 RepID=E4UNN5_ARTGP|nr:hypothetical protein MGYG_08994 [Nannizzia gypsea CBS 118893]EFQ99638.1 hypothetical protein MGYG_08994 [Nannizzia gypsea CBS 118893]
MAKSSSPPMFPTPSASQEEVDAFLHEWVAARWQVPVSSQRVRDVSFRFKGTGSTLYSLSQEEMRALMGNTALGDVLYFSLCYDSPYGSATRGKYASVVSGLSNAARSLGPFIQSPSSSSSSSSSASASTSSTSIDEPYTKPTPPAISWSSLPIRCLSEKPGAQYLNKFYVK